MTWSDWWSLLFRLPLLSVFVHFGVNVLWFAVLDDWVVYKFVQMLLKYKQPKHAYSHAYIPKAGQAEIWDLNFLYCPNALLTRPDSCHDSWHASTRAHLTRPYLIWVRHQFGSGLGTLSKWIHAPALEVSKRFEQKRRQSLYKPHLNLLS